VDTKAIARRIVPDTMLSARHRHGGNRGHPEPIRLRNLKRITGAPPETLRDTQTLEWLIGELGLNDHYPQFMPAALQAQLGRGLRISQYPVQFAPYLAFLADRRISSYVEIGVQHGGTFATTVTYLRTTGSPVTCAVGVDVFRSYGTAKFAQRTPGVSFFRGDSRSEEFRLIAQTVMAGGLVLIDGDHSEEGCRADFALAEQLGATMIALHDIVDVECPGVRAVWRDIRDRYTNRFTFHEFAAQYPDVEASTATQHLGIGIAIRREADR
jgi:cephalosporin hydroxylase